MACLFLALCIIITWLKEYRCMTDMEKLLAVLRDVNEDVDFENETALVDDGVIDSFDINVIIAALDDAFDIHIEVGDIEPENFNSAQAILETVRRYQAAR